VTVDLDTRMRAAGASLRRASERLTPEGPPPGRSRPVMGLAAVALLLLIAAGAMALLGDDHDSPAVSTDPSGAPRLVPDQVPEGLAPTGAVDLPLTDETGHAVAATFSVYGDRDADDPFAHIDLGIVVVERVDGQSDESLGISTEGEPVTVRGHPGFLNEIAPLGLSVGWEETPQLSVQVASFTLDRDQLMAAAEGLAVDGTDVALGAMPPDLTTPLTLVGSTTLTPGLEPFPAPPSTDGHLVGYQNPNDGQAAVIATFVGDSADLAVIRWITAVHQPTSVRGHTGWSGASEPATRTLLWEESPGVLVMVQGFGLDEDDVRAVAESLHPADDAEWAALLDQGDDSDGDSASEASGSVAASSGSSAGEIAGSDLGLPNGAIVRLQGDYGGGSWAVYNDPNGNLCGQFTAEYEDSGSCGPPDAAVITVSIGGDEGPVLLFGVMPPGAVDVDDPSHGTMLGNSQADDGRRYYGEVIEDRPLPSHISFVDDHGQIVETAPLP
jgi:hypothetical protein